MAVLVKLLLLLSLPAFFSCTSDTGDSIISEVPVRTNIEVKGLSQDCPLDIFVFNDDRMGRLDSYQRFGSFREGRISISSRTGNKRVVAIANMKTDAQDWERVLSYDDLSGIRSDLSRDSHELPVLSGQTEISTGSSGLNLCLEPILSEVRINSIGCDFHRHPYKGMSLENVRIYLTNVCSLSPVCGNGYDHPEGIVNTGRLSQEDLEALGDGSMLYREIGNIADMAVLHPDLNLYCYPNTSAEEGPGTPFTRLVIEGSLNGETVYYPININREYGPSEHSVPGIGRNCSYVYDIVLTRKGVDDPDTPISVTECSINCSVQPWNGRPVRIIEY